MSWSFDKPTKAGYYMMNNGDVVTQANMEPIEITEDSEGILSIKDLGGDITPLDSVTSSWKYLDISKISLSMDNKVV